MQDLASDAKAVDLFHQMIVDAVRNDSDVRKAVTEVLLQDVSFSLSCNDYYDYYHSGYRITLSVNGEEVTSDSFSISKSNY